MVRLLAVIAATFLVSGCCRLTGVSESNGVVTGEVGVYNRSKNRLDVGPIIAGEFKHSVGVVGPGAGATMGFAQLTVGGKLEVHWVDDYGAESQKSYVTEFNSNELADVASKVKGIKFTYLGDQVWQLDVYEKPKSQRFVNIKDEKTRLKSIKSVKSSRTKGKARFEDAGS